MKIGSLFSVYGGLDMAIEGDLVWYSEIEPAACKVMAANHPGVPNLGDITKIDWDTVPPVDILTGGYPCQPFSMAGLRKGTNDERHLWPFVRDAIRTIRPRFALLENVRGHLTLGFDVVLSDLAELGIFTRWGVVRAADAGAPHNRARIFILVGDSDGMVRPSASAFDWGSGSLEGSESEQRVIGSNCGDVADSDGSSKQTYNDGRSGTGDIGRSQSLECDREIASNSRGKRYGSGKGSGDLGSMDRENENGSWEQQRSWKKPRTGSVENASDTGSFGLSGSSIFGELEGSRSREHGQTNWGEYETAIRRWESIIKRPPPAPTVRRNDRDRLNPLFVEWMMGLPEGWVTGHGLSAAQELKMLGNGVVPQQAQLALKVLSGAI